MARNNHQEAIERTGETARAGVREATDRAEDVMKTGIQSAQRVADEFGRVFGFGGQNEDLTRQATQNIEAITETGTILMRGFQDVSREWLELTQERLRKNAEGMTKLAQCRTLPDLAAVQSDLARDNLNQIIDVTRRVAERSMKVADEAAKTITAESGKAGRYSRAA
jgi:phasin family protein